MPLHPDEAARRRVINVAAHYRDRRDRAAGPLEEVVVAWDHWRRLLREVARRDTGRAEAIAAQVMGELDADITAMKTTLTQDGQDGAAR